VAVRRGQPRAEGSGGEGGHHRVQGRARRRGRRRADKFSGAFNDPANAPDVAEFGNTDVASYAQTGALSDLTGDISSWSEGKDLLPSVLDTAKSGGKTYGLPWYTGIRALYYRTDVFTELGLKPPATLAELTDDARKIHAAKPDLYGISTGGKDVDGALADATAAMNKNFG
jgi:N,N'-diacetylchitobiose transport system substrate-binding protein